MTLGRRVAYGVGEVLITLGLIVAFFAAYEIYGKVPEVNAHQADLTRQLDRAWTATASILATVPPSTAVLVQSAPPAPGDPIARLYVPAMHQHWVVVEGVDLPDIRYAPGHYPGTAMPGQVGNFAVAGHRIPPLFWNLQDVHAGDDIIVETATNWYVYQVTHDEIVSPHAIEVVAPTPDRLGVPATVASLTLTTCNPKWADYQRLVVHAVLVTTTTHAAGPPVSLGS
ncbi:MAG TPA: class E sortase [Micromonosporaceae bacterium]|jgi:sortase A|nr:class E sortase [Micromonosporaceae bacterium]